MLRIMGKVISLFSAVIAGGTLALAVYSVRNYVPSQDVGWLADVFFCTIVGTLEAVVSLWMWHEADDV